VAWQRLNALGEAHPTSYVERDVQMWLDRYVHRHRAHCEHCGFVGEAYDSYHTAVRCLRRHRATKGHGEGVAALRFRRHEHLVIETILRHRNLRQLQTYGYGTTTTAATNAFTIATTTTNATILPFIDGTGAGSITFPIYVSHR
jgi:hypothetical protein